MTRMISNEVDGEWRAINIYQANDLNGNPVFVLVDVHTGQAFLEGADSMRNVLRTPTFRKQPIGPGWASRVMTSVAAPLRRFFFQPAVPIQMQSPTKLMVTRSVSGGKISVTVQGVGEQRAADGGENSVGTLALPDQEVESQEQIAGYTDQDGKLTFSIDSPDGTPVTIAIPLIVRDVGPIIDDNAKNDIAVAQSKTTADEEVSFLLNQDGSANTEFLNAVITAAFGSAKHTDWFRNFLKMTDSSLYTPFRVGVHVNNTEMVANAFYDPLTDGFFLMRSGTVALKAKDRRGKIHSLEITYESTAKLSILYHEKTHAMYQRMALLAADYLKSLIGDTSYIEWPIDPVVSSEANEAGADIVSVLISGNPVLAPGFMTKIVDITDPKNPKELPLPDSNNIRSAADVTQLDRLGADNPHANNYDPHHAGSPQMETGFQTGKNLAAKNSIIQTLLGAMDAARYTALLFVDIPLRLQPLRIEHALLHAIIADMKPDGTPGPATPFIREAAKARNVKIPDISPGARVEGSSSKGNS